MASLGELKRGDRSLSIEVGDVKINFKYKPGAVTPGLGLKILASMNPVVLFLSECVVWWDVTEDDERTMLPLTEAVLNDFPSAFLLAMQDKIKDDIAGQSKKS